jgi:hypothetical protein
VKVSDKENQNSFVGRHNSQAANDIGVPHAGFAHRFARQTLRESPDQSISIDTNDPDLVQLVDAWSALPRPIQRAILTLLNSSREFV